MRKILYGITLINMLKGLTGRSRRENIKTFRLRMQLRQLHQLW